MKNNNYEKLIEKLMTFTNHAIASATQRAEFITITREIGVFLIVTYINFLLLFLTPFSVKVNFA